jgi:hypothetical protein
VDNPKADGDNRELSEAIESLHRAPEVPRGFT